jgi:hypothetical protein
MNGTKAEGSAPHNGEGEGIENDDVDGARVERMQAHMGRRRFMQATAATATAAALGGVASAQSQEVNFGSDVVQSPIVDKVVTIEEHTADMTSALEYINDSGDLVSLADYGARVAENDEEGTAHNPVTLRADKFASSEYSEFPRGETYTDGDGNEQDLSALDAQHWTTDASGSAGSLTFETVSGPNGEDALHIATTGQTSGDVAKATLTDVEITSGIERKFLQFVGSIDVLESGAVVYVRVRDSSSNVIEAKIDGSGDATAVDVIATGTGSGQVYQSQLGEHSTTLNDIVEIELAVAEANADVTIAGLNLDRESEWTYGKREFVNSDDEVETETVSEPSGEYSITSLSTLGELFRDGAIMDVMVSAEFLASELPVADRRSRWADASVYDYANRLQTLIGFELPTAYALSYGSGAANDDVLLPDQRYNEVGFSRESELPTWTDVDDDNVSWTDRTSQYESTDIGETVEITPSVSTGEVLVVYTDVFLSDDQRATATSFGGGGGGAVMTGAGGGFFGSAMSVVMTVATALGAYLSYAKGWIPGVGS